MMFRFLLDNPYTSSVIFNLFYQSVLIFLVGWILLKIFKQTSAPIRNALSMATLVAAFLLPFGILFFKSNDSILQSISLPSIQQTYRHYILEKESPDLQRIASQESGIQTSSLQIQEPEDQNRDRIKGFFKTNTFTRILNFFGLLWLSGSLFLIFRLSFLLVQNSFLRKSLEKAEDIKLEEVLCNLSKIYGKQSFPPIFTSNMIYSPCSLGIRHPIIIIPRKLFANLKMDELETILIHELSHIHHKDHLFSLLPVFGRILFWWNPLTNSVIARHFSAREFISDNEVIRVKGAYSYAHTLYSLARKTHLVSRIPFSMGMADDRGSLEQRIKTIISKERSMAVHLKKPLKILIVAVTLIASIILARQSWTFSNDQSPQKIIPLPDLIQPHTMVVDKDRLFIRDSGSSIFIYSLSNFSLIKKFGKQGQGPGEFHDSPFLIITDDEIFIGERTKIMRFSRDGKFLTERKLPYSYIGAYPLIPVGDNYVGFPMSRIDNSYRQIGYIYNSEFEQIRQFYKTIPFRIPPPPPPKPGYKTAPIIKTDFEVIRDCVTYEVSENKIFVADTRKGFFISVFDYQGQLLYEINHPYEEKKVPKQFKEAFFDRIRQSDHADNLFRRNNYLFRKVFPAFVDFQINDGKIYVTTNIHKDDLYDIAVLDLNGKILKRSFSLPSKLYLRTLHNNMAGTRVYVIHDNKIFSLNYNEDKEIYELHINSLN